MMISPISTKSLVLGQVRMYRRLLLQLPASGNYEHLYLPKYETNVTLTIGVCTSRHSRGGSLDP